MADGQPRAHGVLLIMSKGRGRVAGEGAQHYGSRGRNGLHVPILVRGRPLRQDRGFRQDHQLEQAAQGGPGDHLGALVTAPRLVEVSQRVTAIVQPLPQSLFAASSHLPASRLTYFDSLVIRISVSDLVAALPQQLLGIMRVAQVLSPLPQASSMPSYTPNFTDDTHSQWFKAADLFSDKLVFPLLSRVRRSERTPTFFHRIIKINVCLMY